MILKYILIFIFSTASFLSFGQIDTLVRATINEIQVTASRINQKVENTTLPITIRDFENDQDTRQQISFNDYLRSIPGVWALNANNYAQDLRVSIRGFGARSAFGIRGVRIIVDGIPETTPDGQGQIDNLNLGLIENIQVIRGPASSLYGNASGGVISITTLNSTNENFLQAGITLGSYNMKKYQLLTGFDINNTNIILLGNYIQTDGYRERSGFESKNFNALVSHKFSNKSSLKLNVNYANSPVANDAGGLKIEDVEADRRQARTRNVDFETGEKIEQLRVSASYKYDFDKGKAFNTYGFYSTRNFYGKLPFGFGGIVDLSRSYYGFGSSYQIDRIANTYTNKLQVGYDIAIQNDDRLRYYNLEGEQGDVTFDQIESFNNIGIYLVDYFSIDKWHINAGLRYDWNELKAKDQLKSNGDNSGNINLNAWNPSLGVSYSLKQNFQLYTNFSTSFETPALSELSANPTGEEGFNAELESQESRSFELGIKATIGSKIRYSASAFHINTDNELVSYEIEAFPDRNFYRNAGSSIRKGIELSLDYSFLDDWYLSSSYTFSDFKYDEYKTSKGDFKDNYLPGIPKNMLGFALKYHKANGLHFQIDGQYNGSLYTNDSNSVSVNSYTLLNTNIGYQIKRNSYSIVPFLGVNNLLNTKYYDNVRINGFGSRYYEPAPELNIYGGIKIRI